MWQCEACKKYFDDEITALEVKFGKVDNEEAMETGDQYNAFYTESAWAPLCDDCAMSYIKGDIS